MSRSFGRMSSSVSSVACRFDVAIQGVKEPQRGVGGVVQAFVLALGKQVRDQPVADVMRKGAQNPARFGEPPGGERESFQADHRVAAPVGEPVVAGDHGAHFVAGGAGAGRVFHAPAGMMMN